MSNYKKVILHIGLAKVIENPKGWLPSIAFYNSTGEYYGILLPEHVSKLRTIFDGLTKKLFFDDQKGIVYIDDKIKKVDTKVQFETYDFVGGVITLSFNFNSTLVIDIKKDSPLLLEAINAI